MTAALGPTGLQKPFIVSCGYYILSIRQPESSLSLSPCRRFASGQSGRGAGHRRCRRLFAVCQPFIIIAGRQVSGFIVSIRTAATRCALPKILIQPSVRLILKYGLCNSSLSAWSPSVAWKNRDVATPGRWESLPRRIKDSAIAAGSPSRSNGRSIRQTGCRAKQAIGLSPWCKGGISRRG